MSEINIKEITAISTELLGALEDSWLTIVLILAGTFVLQKFGIRIVRKTVARLVESSPNESHEAEKRREETIIQIVKGILAVIVWPVALLMVLSELGFDIAPLLAGAGVIGFALGFGAQNLVKDMIAGLFIITENQYRVGDVVKLNDRTGAVERITLRKTTLRDLDGVVHHIPNGGIDIASNYSMEFSGINLNVGVGYESDIDEVIEIINKVGAELAEDETWKPHIIEAPEFLRVDRFADSAIEFKVTGKSMPLQQWAVTGELRKRLKIAFDEAGIEIPYPQRVIHNPVDQE